MRGQSDSQRAAFILQLPFDRRKLYLERWSWMKGQRGQTNADGLSGFHPVRGLTLIQQLLQTVGMPPQPLLILSYFLQKGLRPVQTGSELVLIRQQSLPLCQQGVSVQTSEYVWRKEASSVFSSLYSQHPLN